MNAILLLAGCVFLLPKPVIGQFREAASMPDSIPARIFLWAPFDESTMWVQEGCGVGFAVVGFGVGYLMTPREGDASGVVTGIATIIGTTLGSIGIPLGTYLGGNWMGGNGGWWATCGGCVAGAIVGLLPNIAFKYDDPGVAAIIVSVAAVAGGVVGYHLSASPVERVDTTGKASLRPNPILETGMSVSESMTPRTTQIARVAIRL